MTKKNTINRTFLRNAALLITLVGAAGSLYLMFRVGHRNDSVLLLSLFTAWVVSPFVGFFIAGKIAERWTVFARISLYCLVIILSIVSLIAYNGEFNSPTTKPAFIFLLFPLVSWLLMLIVVFIALRISRSKNNTNQT